MPDYSPSTDPALWPLTPEGREAAAALPIPPDAYLVSSTELKAVQTLAPFGPVVRDARFGEVTRVGEPWDGPYRELRRSYVEGTVPEGWEPHASVVARFEAGLAEHVIRAGNRPLVVATHGMALTVWLDPPSRVPYWEALPFPALIPVPTRPR